MRPPVHTQKLHVCLPEVLHAAVKAKAEQEGMTVNELVRAALRPVVMEAA